MPSTYFSLKQLRSIANKLEIPSTGTKEQIYNRINRKLEQTKQGGKATPYKTRRKRTKSISRRKSRKSRKRSNRKSRKSGKRSYFKRNNKLSEPHKKYCRCILHVADQQSTECLRSKNWGKKVNGKQCYNPYAVCTASTKRTGTPECTKNLNLETIPKSEINALLDIKKMSMSDLKKKYDL